MRKKHISLLIILLVLHSPLSQLTGPTGAGDRYGQNGMIGMQGAPGALGVGTAGGGGVTGSTGNWMNGSTGAAGTNPFAHATSYAIWILSSATSDSGSGFAELNLGCALEDLGGSTHDLLTSPLQCHPTTSHWHYISNTTSLGANALGAIAVARGLVTVNVTLAQNPVGEGHSFPFYLIIVVSAPLLPAVSSRTGLGDIFINQPNCVGTVMNPSFSTFVTLGGGRCDSSSPGTGLHQVSGLVLEFQIDSWSPIGSSVLFGLQWEAKTNISAQT